MRDAATTPSLTERTNIAIGAALAGRKRGAFTPVLFAGPAVIASIAYMDPGNFATNIQVGAKYGYSLLWVVVMANLIAMLFQALSAKLGIVTNRNLAEMCRDQFSRPVVIGMWLLSEVAAMATDLAEFLGGAIALALLFHMPLLAGMGVTAVITYALLTATSVIISLILGWQFLVVILVYMVLSLAYSLRWKRMRWIDIATLASLYTVRVVAGAAAGSVFVSGFMLVFIFPIFITLGCVKRLTELTLAVSNERLPGRGYSRSDRGDLLNMAWLGGIGALVTFFLYTLSDQARTLYPIQWVLWLAMVPIALWLLRMIRLGYFGKQDYDPIVFALRDKRGVGLLLIILSLMFYAAGLWQDWFGFELSVR